MTSLERFRAQLDAITRKPLPKKPLTGLEKQALEQQEITEFWKELESK